MAAVKNGLPTATYLRERLSYDPKTGVLRWRRRPRSHFETDNIWGTWNTRYAGQTAGWPHNAGYNRLVSLTNRGI